jgi:hypothetical protein
MTYLEIHAAFHDHGVKQAYSVNNEVYAEVLPLISTLHICIKVIGEYKWFNVPLDWFVGIENNVFLVNSKKQEVVSSADIKPQILPEPKPILGSMGQLKLF